ncbi:hypothetical protein QPK87_39015 [Kamptonema cortianum]|nr:hypothetical protein [Geitlerinema splendidum]MDK3162494.1 hypothetical protein [Kamptonema cortianum]
MPEPVGGTSQREPDPDMEFVRERLMGNRKIIAWMVGIGVIGAGLWTLFVPPVYEARASVIMPAAAERSGALGLAASLGLTAGDGSNSNLSMLGAILDSERMLNVLHESTGIEKKKLRERRSVRQNKQSNIIEIKFKDKNPDRALKMCSTALESLELFNSELSIRTQSHRADLLKAKVEEYLDNLRDLERRFERFVRNSKSVPVPLVDEKGETEKAFISAKATLQKLRSDLTKLNQAEVEDQTAIKAALSAQGRLPTDIPQMQTTYDDLLLAEREYVTAKATYTESAPQVVQLKQKVDALRAQVRQQAQDYSKAYNSGLIKDGAELRVAKKVIEDQIRELEIQVEVAPVETTEYIRLKGEADVLQEVIKQLTVQWEQAELDRASDPNRWEILDQPELADKPVNKRFGLSLGIGLATSLFLGLLVALAVRPKV